MGHGEQLADAFHYLQRGCLDSAHHQFTLACPNCQRMRMERLSDQVSNDPNKLKREMERKRLFTAMEDEIMLRAWLRCALHHFQHFTLCDAA